MAQRMEKRRIANGMVVEVPAGLSKGGRMDYVLQNYPVKPQDIERSWQPEQAEPMSAFTGFSAGLQNYLAERGLNPRGRAGPSTPMWENPEYGGPAAVPPSGVASTVGRLAIPVAAGIGVSQIPGAQGIGAQMLLQAGTAGALDYMADDATAWDATKSAGAAAVGTWGGSMVGRWLSGAKTNMLARLQKKPVAFPKENRNSLWQSMGRFTQGAGGMNSIIKTQIRAMNSAVGKVFGITDDTIDDIDEVFLGRAREHVNMLYKAAEPNGPVDIEDVREVLVNLQNQGVQSAKINRLLEMTDSSIQGKHFQDLRRTLTDIKAEMSGDTVHRMLAPYMDDALDAADKAAIKAGGNKAMLSAANQKYKFLETLEEINSTLEAGEVPAGQLIRLMKRDNYKGFGKRLIAEGAGRDRIIPEILEAMDTGKTIADFTRRTAGGSATAGREAGISPMFQTFGDLINPEANFGPAVTRLATTGMTRMPGKAVIGNPATGRAFGGVAGPAAAEVEKRKQVLPREIPDLFVPDISAP